jgi:hypothetical protein
MPNGQTKNGKSVYINKLPVMQKNPATIKI